MLVHCLQCIGDDLPVVECGYTRDVKYERH